MMVTDAALNALRTNFKREFEQSKQKAKPKWQTVATLVSSTSRSNTYGWLGQFPKMREWIGSRQYKSMKESSYAIENKDWEATVSVDRNNIEDDELGIYTPLLQEMGYSAATYPDELVFELMTKGDQTPCYDGQSFFDKEHPIFSKTDGTGDSAGVSNIIEGDGPGWYLLDTRRALKPLIFQQRKAPDFVSKTDPRTSDNVFDRKEFAFGVDARSNVGFGFWQMAFACYDELNEETLNEAIRRMMEFKADGGRPLGIVPNLLVVPPALRAAANQEVLVPLKDGGGTNPNYKVVEVSVNEWLAA